MKTKIHFLLLLSTIILIGTFLNACSDDEDEKTYVLDNVSVYTLSSSIEENNLKSAKITENEEDIIWSKEHAGLNLKVVGVQGVLEKIWLMANSGGELVLFEDREIEFDLSELQKLIDSEQKVIHSFGDLNTVNVKIKYLDITVLFKGERHIIRQVAQDGGVPGAKVWDLMLKDPASGQFKWVTLDTRQLVDQRPANENNVVRMNSFATDNGEQEFCLGMDNLSNKKWIRNPPPWNKNLIVETNGGRFAIFYTLSESSINKELDVYLDICFANAACFCAYKSIGDPLYGFYVAFDTNNYSFFNVLNEGQLDDICDFEGNTFNSDEFTITDILPGMGYPDVIVNVTVEEKEIN